MNLLTNNTVRFQQLSLLRDVVLHGSVPGNISSTIEADEKHWRRARRAIRPKSDHVADPFFPLGVLPHYVDPRGLRLYRGLLKGARSAAANVGLHPLRVYLKLVASAKACAQRNVLSVSSLYIDKNQTSILIQIYTSGINEV